MNINKFFKHLFKNLANRLRNAQSNDSKLSAKIRNYSGKINSSREQIIKWEREKDGTSIEKEQNVARIKDLETKIALKRKMLETITKSKKVKTGNINLYYLDFLNHLSIR